MLQHSFAEIWGRFEDFLAIFNFFLNFFSENFGQQVRVVNQSKKLVQYLLSVFRFHGVVFRSQISKKTLVWRKLPLLACFELGYTIRHRI